jgi:hypothetical protein
MRLRSWLLAIAAALAALGLATTSASTATKGCGLSGYSYAGVQSFRDAYGVRATLTEVAQPLVERGHVAAWVGIGAPGEGLDGTDEWLQVGLNRIAGDPARLYYELALPSGVRYVELASTVPEGRTYDVAVLRVAGRPNAWRVWVDNHPASKAIYLPRSDRTLTPMAIAENWDGGDPACNRYAYRFGGVSVAGRPGGSWTLLRKHDVAVMRDPGHRILPTSGSGTGFLALTAPPPPRVLNLPDSTG